MSRPGDLDAASRAAIWEVEVEEREAAEARPLKLDNVLTGGEGGLAHLPILSFTEPTSGASDPALGRPRV